MKPLTPFSRACPTEACFQTFRRLSSQVTAGADKIVPRYAAVGHQIAVVETAGIALRYTVANPSSYVYFDESRPVSPAFDCLGFNTPPAVSFQYSTPAHIGR
jgi:hypothetical protein